MLGFYLIFFSLLQPAVVAHAHIHSTWEAEAGRSGMQKHAGPCSEFESSLGYNRPCLQNKKAGAGARLLEGLSPVHKAWGSIPSAA